MSKVLVISVHPDDETVGCGAMLFRHRAEGDRLTWLIVTQTHEPAWPAPTIARKADEVDRVASVYGFERVTKLGFPSTRLDIVPQVDLMAGIREAAEHDRPDILYLVSRGDVHSDHRCVFEATTAVYKPFLSRSGLRRLLCYETLSSTDAAPALPERSFVPNVYADITPFMEQKIATMGLFETELQPDPLPRGPSAMRALARYRGATIGVQYAEAFMLLREIV